MMNLIIKVSPDWICMVTSRFIKLFYIASAKISHIFDKCNAIW